MYLKQLFRLLLLTGIVCFFYFSCFFFTFERGVSSAFAAFVRGDISISEQLLEEHQQEISEGEYFFAKACLASDGKELSRSDRYLRQAMTLTDTDPKLPLVFLEMVNRYKIGEFSLMWELFSPVKDSLEENEGWLHYFLALESSYHRRFQEEYREWIHYLQLKEPTKRAWFEQVVANCFGQHRPILSLARCKIERGYGKQARRLLRSYFTRLTGKERQDYWWLLGLSYLKEEGGDTEEALSCFNKMTFPCHAWLTYQIEQEALAGIETIDLQSLMLLGSLLEKMENQPLVTTFYTQVCERVIKEVTAEKEDMLSQLVVFQPLEKKKHPVFFEMGELLLKRAHLAIEQGQLSLLGRIKEVVEHLGSEQFQQKWSMRFAQLLEASLVDKVLRDDDELRFTRDYLALCQEYEASYCFTPHLTDEVLTLSEHLWKNEKQRPKAIRLVRMVTEPWDSKQRERVIRWVERIYAKTQQTDDLEVLPYLWELVQALELKELDFEGPNEIANLMEDVRFLLSRKQYELAKEKLNWIVKVAPNNEAKQLLGWIAYCQYEVKKALFLLKEGKLKDPSFREALGICEILEGERLRGNAHLAEVATISEEGKRCLAFGLLARGDLEEGLLWLQKIDTLDEQARVGLAWIAYQKGEWKRTIRLLSELSLPLASLDFVRCLQLRAKIKSGKKLDPSLLSWEQTAFEGGAPSLAFSHFISTQEQTYDRHYLAALFFKAVQPNDALCLEYLDQVPLLSQEGRLDRIEVLFALGQQEEAKKELSELMSLSLSDDFLKEVALALYKKQQWQELKPVVERYLTRIPNDCELKEIFAHTFAYLQMYKRAFAEFKELFYLRPVASSDLPLLIRCLVHLGEHELADQLLMARSWQFLPAEQLEVARLMVIAKKESYTKEVVAKLSSSFMSLSFSEQRQFLRLLLDLGEYSQALSFSDAISPLMKSDPEGLVLLAELQTQLLDR